MAPEEWGWTSTEGEWEVVVHEVLVKEELEGYYVPGKDDTKQSNWRYNLKVTDKESFNLLAKSAGHYEENK